MAELKVSVMPRCLAIEDPYEAMRVAAGMGADAIHLSVGWSVFTLEAMTTAKCHEVRRLVEDLGLTISATSGSAACGDMGEPNDKRAKLTAARRSLEIARDLGCEIWQAHIGIVPSDRSDPRWRTYVDLLTGIGALGEQIGACLAIETGPEPPRVLAEVIETVGSDAIRINFDPANLIYWPAYMIQQGMKSGPYDRETVMADFDPVAGARLLAPYIVHTHAKDALVTAQGQPLETPLGQGWVDWPAYVGVLRQVGYDGYHAVERESGDDRIGDTTRAVEFLKSL